MIKSIRHRGLKRFHEQGDSTRLNSAMLPRIGRVLTSLEGAQSIRELDLPGFRLHALKGDLNGFWSLTISGNWRIIFRFENSNVFDVDLVDYH